MSENEEKYRKIFYAEALDNFEELNRYFTLLEKDHSDASTIEAIFRITHTLKGNAMGLGLEGIAELSHVMEDIFAAIKAGNLAMHDELFNMLFKANDKLGALIEAIQSGKRVSHKGIRTKLSVYLREHVKEQEITTSDEHGEVEESQDQNVAEKKEGAPGGMEDFDKIALEHTEQQQTSSSNEVESEQNLDSKKEEVFSQTESLAFEDDFLDEDEDEDDEDTSAKITFSDQIQVSVSKLDNLLNLVGELMIEKDALSIANSEGDGNTLGSLGRLHRITSDLQYAVMDVRLVQVGFFFNKFYRTVRDAASISDKKVGLHLEGTEIEIDRNILKIISDSIIHLIRNAVGHGIESPEERRKAGKPEEGKLYLKARNEKDFVIISVEDDGAGIDYKKIVSKAIHKKLITAEQADHLNKEEALMLIFLPGFSSAESINEISGRGVGMDVVKRATESIGGSVQLHTEIGKGTSIELNLPASMALKASLLFELQQQEFAIPLAYTEAVVSMTKEEIYKVSSGLMSTYLDQTISIIFLQDIFKLNSLKDIQVSESIHQEMHKSFDQLKDDETIDVVIVSYQNHSVGLVVDKLLQQKEIVEKTLANPLDKSELFSGVTILGNGHVCLVLDAGGLIKAFFRTHGQSNALV